MAKPTDLRRESLPQKKGKNSCALSLIVRTPCVFGLRARHLHTVLGRRPLRGEPGTYRPRTNNLSADKYFVREAMRTKIWAADKVLGTKIAEKV